MRKKSTICKVCGNPKEKIPCKSCNSFWSKLRGYCKQCDNRGYFLVCPDQSKHEIDELLRHIERDIKWDEERSKQAQNFSSLTRRIKPNYQPKIGCLYCNFTGYKTEMVKKHNPTALWPNYTIENKSVPCPMCNSNSSKFRR